MSRTNKTIKTEGNITTILITKNDDPLYLKEVIIDTEDLPKTGIARRSNGKYEYFRATVSDRVTKVNSKAQSQTKRYTKQFNINKLGEEEAFKQAKQWLDAKKEEFNYLPRS